ncbi:MAG: hypothetical protein RIF41_35225 [Polyangiaceae bacterium]
MTKRAELIADVLMGAAHADPLQEEPEKVVRHALEQLMGAAYLLANLDARLSAFEAKAFDMKATVKALGLEGDLEKRQLLELIAAVEHADDVIALEEDQYLRAVAEELGLPEEAYADLVIDVVEARDSRMSLEPPNRVSLISARDSLLGPPPLPKQEDT